MRYFASENQKLIKNSTFLLSPLFLIHFYESISWIIIDIGSTQWLFFFDRNASSENNIIMLALPDFVKAAKSPLLRELHTK